MAKAISESVNEECNPLNSAYFAIKGEVKELDIIEIELSSSEKKIYSFLGIAYGFIADVDLESEV